MSNVLSMAIGINFQVAELNGVNTDCELLNKITECKRVRRNKSPIVVLSIGS